jgi:aspartyl-tRNA(Asn)/glutamyl-tRNA(Gln) amidotransferase subunit A
VIDWPDIIARNAPLNAFIDFDRQATGGEGPLAGLTIGIKSNIAVKGLPWTAGMGLRRAVIAERDAGVVARLRGAGAIILGTLNMHEAALGSTTSNAFYGATMNPHRAGYTPGGSSGGSGAAVAAGLCDAALGTDTMGSVRIPAAYCGVYGLKPTNGAVSDDGLVMLEPSLDCIGPLARDLSTLEKVWHAITGPLVPSEVEGRGHGGRETPLARDERILVLDGLGRVDVQPAVPASYERALAALGGSSQAIALPDSPTDIRLAGFVAAGRYLVSELGDDRRTNAHLISSELHFMLEYAASAEPRPEVLARTRMVLRDAIGAHGVLVMPTAPQAAFPHGRAPANQADFTCLANIAGLPALAIPAGRDEDGLPVGVQLVGPPQGEARLIALARRLEPELGGYIPPRSS